MSRSSTQSAYRRHTHASSEHRPDDRQAAPIGQRLFADNSTGEVVRSFLASLPGDIKNEMSVGDLERLLQAVLTGLGVSPVSNMSLRVGDVSEIDRIPDPRQLVADAEKEVSVNSAADMLGVSRQAVISAIHRGALKARRLEGSRALLVEVASVRAYRRRVFQAMSPDAIGHDGRGAKPPRRS